MRPVPDAGRPWIINVGGRAYGPYNADQMRGFAGDGRVVANSQVARAGENVFRNAIDDPDLAPIFARPHQQRPPVEQVRPRERPASFGKERDGNDAAPSATSRFIIVADMKSGSIGGLEEEIAKLGNTCSVLPQVWLLSTELTISAIRNALIQKLGKVDMLLVIDAARDKAAWFNFGPEMDARIRRLWTKQPDPK